MVCRLVYCTVIQQGIAVIVAPGPIAQAQPVLGIATGPGKHSGIVLLASLINTWLFCVGGGHEGSLNQNS